MLPDSAADQPGADDPKPTLPYWYCFDVCVRPPRGLQPWEGSLEGTTPGGRAIERRKFGSLMDLMRFLEALVNERGLR